MHNVEDAIYLVAWVVCFCLVLSHRGGRGLGWFLSLGLLLVVGVPILWPFCP